jgi:hypothetical protein
MRGGPLAAAGALAACLAGAPAARGAEVALSFGDAPGGAAAGFRIERREAGAQKFEVLALLGPGVADFVDRGLPAGSSYCYRVRALAAEPASAWSPEVCADAKEPAPEPAPGGGAAGGEPQAGGEAAAAEPASEAGAAPAAPPAPEPRRIRTSGGWLQVLD